MQGVGVAIAVVIVYAALFGNGFQPFWMTQEKNAAPNSAGIKPTVTNVAVKESVVKPQSSVVKTATTLGTPTSTIARFILPLFHSAFAITTNTATSTEWAVPTSGNPKSVSVGSSGNVYFTENTGNKIGRLVPSTNVITEWTSPTAASQPDSVSVDSSGNVYFAEFSVNKIGKLVPSTNVITEWTVPTASSGLTGVSVDSSGNVYFTEYDGNNIGRLS